MRKILPVVILVLLVAAGGGYYWYWNKRAGEFRDMFAQTVATINENAKSVSPSPALLRYEAIEPTGFPFGMTLVMKKPVLDVPVSALLQKSPHASGANPANSWIEEFTYGDSISVSGNITGNKFTLTAAGDRTDTALVNGVVRTKFLSSSASPMVCHLAVEQTGTTPWVMQPIFTDLQTFLSIFRGVDCAVSGISVKDPASGTVLFTADKVSMSGGNEPSGTGNHKVFMTVTEDKAKATPAFDSILHDFGQLTYWSMGKPDAPAMMPFSTYGEQNVDISIRYDGPTTTQGFVDPAMHLSFDVKPFELSNALFNETLEAHIASSAEGATRTATAKVTSNGDVAAEYDTYLVQRVASVIRDLKDKKEIPPEMGHQMDRLGSPEEVAALILPKFHPLGKTAFDLDFSAKGPSQTDAFLRQGALTLNALNWTSTPYGFKIKGNLSAGAATEGAKPAPSGELAINCLSCDTFITGLGNYALRLQTLATRMHPEQPPYVTPDLVEGFRTFLHGIAQTGSAKDLAIDIVLKNTGEVTVSGKQMMEVIGLFGTTVASRLPQAHSVGSSPSTPEPALPGGSKFTAPAR